MFVIYLLISLLIFVLEFKIWRTITPTIIIFSGVTVVLTLHFLFSSTLEFVQLNSIIFIYLFIFLLISFISSLLSFLFIYNNNSIIDSHHIKKISIKLFAKEKMIFSISMFLLLIFIFYAIIKAYKTVGIMAGDNFEYLLSYGIVGHSFALLMACTPITYLFFNFSTTILFKRFFLMILCISLFFLFLKQVKYWSLVPSVWIAIINFHLYGVKFNLKFLLKIISLILLSVMIFFFTYLFSLYVFGVDVDFYYKMYDTAYHFIGYLFSGIIVFSSLINDGYFNELPYRDVCGTFTGACNIIDFFRGLGLYSEENIFIIDFYTLENVFNKKGNVPTLWGVFMLHLGWTSFIFYFLLSLFIYFIFILSRTRLPFFLYYTGLISFMFFSWFASYFALLSIYEIPLLSLFVIWFLLIFPQKKILMAKI